MNLNSVMPGLKGTGPQAKAAHGQQQRWQRPCCPFVCSHGLEHRAASEMVADLSVSAVSSFSWEMAHASNRPPW